MAAGGRSHTPTLPAAGAWGQLWRGLLAAVRSYDHSEDPIAESAAVVPSACSDFTDLFARYHLSLLDYLFGMTRDRELAADLVQDTFVRALAAAPDLTGIAQPRAWLYRIATNVALNANRHRRHFEWLPLSRIEPDMGREEAEAWSMLPAVELPQDHEDLAVSVAEREAIWSVLAELPPRWRAVLLLQTTAGFDVREIAALLQLSEANVRKCHFRAKERFRVLYRQLHERGVEG
jgi:RNA polymerase sigma-70 factor (ECF subfamily)